jgi:CheY-like chemotaxis protein
VCTHGPQQKLVTHPLSLSESFRETRAIQIGWPAEEALRLAPEWRPDLAILDVYLPGMNGIDLAASLRGAAGGALLRAAECV